MEIQSIPAWLWGRFNGAAMSVGAASPEDYWRRADASAPATIRHIRLGDLGAALRQGLADFTANRTDVLFLCLVYPVIGLVLGRLASGYNMIPLLFPLVSGFALVGPIAAIGLNEMSRRREMGAEIGWTDAFAVLRAPSIGAIALLSLVLLCLFLAWLWAASAIYDSTLGPLPPLSMTAFVQDVLTTHAGRVMIGVGMLVGFLFAVVVLAISVVSFPLLLDRHASFLDAITTSLRAMLANPGPLAAWGLIVAVGLVLGSLPMFLGLIVVMPVLGHATWHLYRKLIR